MRGHLFRLAEVFLAGFIAVAGGTLSKLLNTLW